MPGDHNETYRPVRRTNLACLNCRIIEDLGLFKCEAKRVTVERRYAVRVKNQFVTIVNVCLKTIECRYPEEIKYARPDLPGTNTGAVFDRLQSIENQLGDLNAKVEKLLNGQSGSQPSGASTGQDLSWPSPLNAQESFNSPPSPTLSTPGPGVVQESIQRNYLPDSVPLPVLMSTIDVYFRCCHNQPYSFFHEQTFRQRLSNGLIPDHLIFAVLATAVRFSTHPFYQGRTHEAATTYADRSWKSIVRTCFSRNDAADVATVQTITLLAIFDFTAGHTRHGSAWIKIGLSVRIAQDLRLMKDPDPGLSPVSQEERRRAFWSLYLVDRVVSCGRARPPAILEASCQLQLPCDETSWREGKVQKTDTLDQLPNKALLNKDSLGPFALVIIMAHIMTRGAQYMLQEYNIRSRDPPWDPNSDFASISSDLLYVESQFEMGRSIHDVIADSPSYNAIDNTTSAGLIVYSRALFYLTYCLLNHPFLLRRRLEASHTKAPLTFLVRSFGFGRLCAKRLTHHLVDAQSTGYLMNASFYGYCAVIAGSINALYLHSPDESIRNEAVECVQLNLGTLERLGNVYENNSAMFDALAQFSSDTSRFYQLVAPDSQTNSLSSTEQEILWSMVDYSTMSSAVKVTQVYHSEDACSLDASLQSWLDLFCSDAGFGTDTSGIFQDQISFPVPVSFSNDYEQSDGPGLCSGFAGAGDVG